MDALLKGFEIVARHLFLVAFSTVMFCRVCGFRVSAWDSYRTSRSFGYGYGSVTELTEVPCNVARSYRTHRSSGRVQKNSAPSPRVLWHGAYRNHRSSGYGYECPTELTEVPGTGVKVLQDFQKFQVLRHGRTELTEVPGRYKNAVPYPGYCGTVIQILQKFRVRVRMSYRTHRSSLYGYGCSTELTEVPGTGNTRG